MLLLNKKISRKDAKGAKSAKKYFIKKAFFGVLCVFARNKFPADINLQDFPKFFQKKSCFLLYPMLTNL